MRAKLILPAIAAGLVVLAGCDIEDLGGSFERYHEDFHYNYPLKSGGRLAVDGFNGSVEVSMWDQETVDISGTKYARSQEETADLKIEVDHSAGLGLRSAPSGPVCGAGTTARNSPSKFPAAWCWTI